MKEKLTAITYANAIYETSAHWNLWTAKHVGGADVVRRFGPEDIDETFRQEHADILAQKRGNGYWLWKPYIILRTLETMQEGEFLMYMDAGAFYLRSIQHLVRQLEEDGKDILLSMTTAHAGDWCKRDAFVLMDCEGARDAFQIEGGYILVRKTPASMAFFRQWLAYACDARILTDLPNTCGLPDWPEFREHRHDQSILTLLAYKNGIDGYRAVNGPQGMPEDTAEYRALMARYNAQPGVARSCYPWIAVNTRLGYSHGLNFAFRILRKTIKVLRNDWRIRHKKWKKGKNDGEKR